MIKIIAAVYIFILAGIVVLADFRQTQFIFGFIEEFPFGDKIGHFLLMGMFSFLVNLACGAKIFRIRNFSCLLGSLVVLAIVTAEEVSQIFVSGRTFDPGDLLADVAGILIFG
jgi:VanZ family protein